mmetsp:Transcript_21870/g.55480  ORF Transcript_21870/g.55480 Transcript_21870/m.55480 type:complete len:215 (-) Transcript_21870:12-656(-)
MSISLRPPESMYTVCTASSARSTIRSEKRLMNLVPMEERTRLRNSSRLPRSMGKLIAFSTPNASSRALRKPEQMTVGWKSRMSSGSATCSISPAITITDVVPSPTSSSCARESSTIDFAPGCETSTSRRIALPSFVITIPPVGSSSILSIDLGPSVVRIMSATALPAVMLPSCALRPDSRLVLVFNTMTGGFMAAEESGRGRVGAESAVAVGAC